MLKIKEFLKTVFHIDHFYVSVLTVAVMSLLYSIIIRIEFLDPVAKTVEELSMTDIYYRINHSSETEESKKITIVDITDLSERQRDSIAIVVNQVVQLKPEVVGIDIIFEYPFINNTADTDLEEAIINAADEVHLAMACKLSDPDFEGGFYKSSTRSFFANDTDIAEGSVNVLSKYDQNLTKYPVYLLQNTDTVYSLPALMAQMESRRTIKPDNGIEHTIIYESIHFPVVKYQDILASRHLIEGRCVLIGAMGEERDKHITPIGELPGVEVIAYSLNSMLKSHRIFHGGLIWIIITAVLAGWMMNAFEYLTTRFIKKKFKNLFLDFFTESEIYDKIMALIFIVIFTGFTYWLYIKHGFYVNTWLSLGTIAFIEEGRLIYKSWITYWRKKGHPNSFKHSLYSDEIKTNHE